jgi:hypothetical protein
MPPAPNLIPPLAVIAASVVGASAFVLNPSLPLVTPQMIPPGNTIVGCPWGGGLPFGSSLISKLSSLLVPERKTPVSVFPPFHLSRTRKAICIIFAENEKIHNSNNEVARFKRSLARNHLRRKQRSRGFLYRKYRKTNNFLEEKTANI